MVGDGHDHVAPKALQLHLTTAGTIFRSRGPIGPQMAQNAVRLAEAMFTQKLGRSVFSGESNCNKSFVAFI